MNNNALKEFLDRKVDDYNQPSFIKDDPISIPHIFLKRQDIEIAGFFAALLAWGNRKSIINSCKHLLNLMNNAPYDFIMNMNDDEPEGLFDVSKFVHRTFNGTDLLYLLNFLRYHYRFQNEESLETAFTKWMMTGDKTTENALNGFHHYVFSEEIDPDYPERAKKHIAAPYKKSTCKRLNMFLRWMVRKDNKGVDFGIWENISSSQLICPIDLHVARVARHFNLLQRKQTDWQAALELTARLRTFDEDDPVKYDFALFGLGVVEKFG